MQVAIYIDAEDVESALARLGVPLAILQRAVQAGYVSKINRTSNDASNASGFYQWNDTVRSLRENMTVLEWTRSDDGNWPITVHPEKLIGIAVSSGNQNTGRQNAIPSTRSSKGPKTVEAVESNRQSWFPGMEPRPLEKSHVGGFPVWFLLYYADIHELRAELSLAVRIDSDGHVSAWSERIILPALPLNGELIVPEPDFGPDVDIKIVKKG